MFQIVPNAENLRILIVRLTALGDVVYALPALEALRRHCPTAHIGWAVEQAAAGVLQRHPDIDELIVVPRKSWSTRLKRGHVVSVLDEVSTFRRNLKASAYNIAIDLQGNLRGALVARATGAEHRVGFAPPDGKEFSHVLRNTNVAIPSGVHRVERNLLLLREIGVPVASCKGRLPEASEDVRSVVDRLLADTDVPDTFAILHPGVSRFGAFKQWPVESYIQLGCRLSGRGIGVVVSAGPGEESLADSIARMVPKAALVRGLDLPTLAELIRRGAVFVGSDTGPTQMSWMLDTPTVALMGPKDLKVYGPPYEPHSKITAPVECRPCSRRRCADPLCMKEIAVDQVFEAAISIMR